MFKIVPDPLTCLSAGKREMGSFTGKRRPLSPWAQQLTLNRLVPDPEIGIADSNQVGAINHALQVFYVLINQINSLFSRTF
jgi:hypothetical protein